MLRSLDYGGLCSQALLEVDVIGTLLESSAFFPILGVHILAGLICLVTGIMSMVSEKRAGLHPRCWTIYHWALGVLVTSAGCLAAAHWTDDRLLLLLGVVSFGASGLGRTARRRNWQTWIGTHMISMGCSFIAMLTAFCVEEGESLRGLSRLPRLTYWFLPALVGTPLIIRALVRHRMRYQGAATLRETSSKVRIGNGGGLTPSMRRPVSVKAFLPFFCFFFPFLYFFFFQIVPVEPRRLYRHPSIRTLG